jgi:hypothetical protein
VTIGRDQALANKSFTQTVRAHRVSQGKLAKREGRSPAWVTFRLCFERFLRFAGTVSLPADLTERHFSLFPSRYPRGAVQCASAQ